MKRVGSGLRLSPTDLSAFLGCVIARGNPAMLEQQIGRVDRIGSLSRRENKSIEVIYAWVPGTYEEHMAGRVQHRQAMMRVLLGAGDRLADTAEEQDRIEVRVPRRGGNSERLLS